MAYIGREPQIGNFQVCDAISVVNGQAAYTMQVSSVNVSPETAFHVLCSLNGVLQKPGSSFTVSGSTITFASNLVTGDVIDFIHILGSVLDLGVPSDSTVSLAKLTATGTKDATTFLRGDNSFAVPAGGDNTPYYYVRKTSDQTGINHNTAVKATFDTEDLDSDSAYASDKFTVPSGEGGRYFLFASAPLFAYATSKLRRAEIMLYKNGSLLKRTYSDYQANDIQASYENVSGIFDLSASDYIETYVRIRSSDSGNSNYIQGSTSTTTVMGGYKLIG